MFKLLNDFSALTHISKITTNDIKKKIVYYLDGKIETQVFADSSKYDDAVSEVEDAGFLLIGKTYYNIARISIADQNGANVTYHLVGNVVISHDYDSVADAEDAISALEDSFFELNGKYYNASQLLVANTDKGALTIIYDFGGEQFKVQYEDSTTFEDAISKITETSGGGGGGGGGGGKSVATPTFTLKPGAVDVGAKTKITCSTEGADIYYTTDGSTPTLDSPKYTGEDITVPDGGITIKAIGVKLGLATSKVATGAYTIKPDELDYYAGVYNNPDLNTDVIPDPMTKEILVNLVGLDSALATKAAYAEPGAEHVFTGISEQFGGRIIYAYPASFGPLTKFVTNGIQGDIGDSFTLINATINGVEYNIYALTDSTTVDSAPYAFF